MYIYIYIYLFIYYGFPGLKPLLLPSSKFQVNFCAKIPRAHHSVLGRFKIIGKTELSEGQKIRIPLKKDFIFRFHIYILNCI